MWHPDSDYRDAKGLRAGWTTGTCAAAAAEAAATLLLTGNAPEKIRIKTPSGKVFTVKTEGPHFEGGAAVCGVRKYSGDDPDVTNGILIVARVQKAANGVTIEGGRGVGIVTKPGLSMPVGEAAINPGPRKQITEALERVQREVCCKSGFKVIVSAEGGEELAKKTCNERLGIMGGISILGTSGVVEPMSEKALVDTIFLELDSIYAQGMRDVLLCPGGYGMDFARNALGLELERGVKCSNFIGEALDHAAYLGFSDILLVGHAGKLVKLAAGIMQTHSAVADARREIITSHAALCGACRDVLEKLMDAVSVDAMSDILESEGLLKEVFSRVGEAADERLAFRLKGRSKAGLIMFTNKHGILYRSLGAEELCKRMRGKL